MLFTAFKWKLLANMLMMTWWHCVKTTCSWFWKSQALIALSLKTHNGGGWVWEILEKSKNQIHANSIWFSNLDFEQGDFLRCQICACRDGKFRLEIVLFNIDPHNDRLVNSERTQTLVQRHPASLPGDKPAQCFARWQTLASNTDVWGKKKKIHTFLLFTFNNKN